MEVGSAVIIALCYPIKLARDLLAAFGATFRWLLVVGVILGLVALIGARLFFDLVFYGPILSALILAVWWLAHRSSFRAHASWRLRGLWRRWWVYDRHWNRTMRGCGLHLAIPNKPDRYPERRRLKVTPWMDLVLVKPLKGQSIEDFERLISEFALGFNARSCRVRAHARRHNRLWLEFPRVDPLADADVQPFPFVEVLP